MTGWRAHVRAGFLTNKLRVPGILTSHKIVISLGYLSGIKDLSYKRFCFEMERRFLPLQLTTDKLNIYNCVFLFIPKIRTLIVQIQDCLFEFNNTNKVIKINEYVDRICK